MLKVLSISTKKYSINNVISTKWYPKKKLTQWLTGIDLVIVFSLIFVVFRFGGALSYTNSINWESAARLNSNLLNETILDDAQALYRIKSIAKRTSELEIFI